MKWLRRVIVWDYSLQESVKCNFTILHSWTTANFYFDKEMEFYLLLQICVDTFCLPPQKSQSDDTTMYGRKDLTFLEHQLLISSAIDFLHKMHLQLNSSQMF